MIKWREGEDQHWAWLDDNVCISVFYRPGVSAWAVNDGYRRSFQPASLDAAKLEALREFREEARQMLALLDAALDTRTPNY
jgi:hypothetical protein